MRTLRFAAAIVIALTSAVDAREYYNKKWFDYPDPGTAPQIANGCAHWLKTDSFKCKGGFKCGHAVAKVCTNPTHVKVALLRKGVYVVVSGPDAVDAVEGYV